MIYFVCYFLIFSKYLSVISRKLTSAVKAPATKSKPSRQVPGVRLIFLLV